MSVDLSNKKIIMVHGLASKPPRDITHELWRKTLVENIRVDQGQLAKSLDANPQLFESAYWADAVPHHIPDDRAYCKKLEAQVDKVIAERRETKDSFHVGAGEKLGSFFKDRGLDLVKLLAGALTVKDDVMTHFLRETELYDQDQYIADRIRAPLEDALRRAKYANRRVKMFVTMGSPLGDPTVRNLLFASHHQDHGRRQFPTNIERWHNYACLGDVVSHQKNFHEAFYQPMRKLQIFPAGKKFRSIDYVDLHNPFEVVTHAGNRKKEKRNPHKSYGYLAQPRLGSWVADYLLDRLR
jgi:hypothetical protein